MCGWRIPWADAPSDANKIRQHRVAPPLFGGSVPIGSAHSKWSPWPARMVECRHGELKPRCPSRAYRFKSGSGHFVPIARVCRTATSPAGPADWADVRGVYGFRRCRGRVHPGVAERSLQGRGLPGVPAPRCERPGCAGRPAADGSAVGADIGCGRPGGGAARRGPPPGDVRAPEGGARGPVRTFSRRRAPWAVGRATVDSAFRASETHEDEK